MIIVRNRVLVIPVNERNIGTGFDINSDIRQIQISRYQTGGVDLSELDFYIDVTLPDKNKDTAMLKKEVQTEYIVLTWEISQRQVSKVGTVFVTVKAMNREATVRWATNRAAFYVGEIDSPPSAEGNALTVLQQAIQNFTNLKNKVEALAESLHKKIETGLEKAIEKLELKYREILESMQTTFTELTNRERRLSEERTQEFNELKTQMRANWEKLRADVENVVVNAGNIFNQKTQQVEDLLKQFQRKGNETIEEIKTAAKEQRQRLEQVIQSAKTKIDEITALVNSIKEDLKAGKFKGETGEKGKDGRDGRDATIHTIDGQYSFNVDERGHLILTHKGQKIDLGAITPPVPLATKTTAGIIKVGNWLEINNGELSADVFKIMDEVRLHNEYINVISEGKPPRTSVMDWLTDPAVSIHTNKPGWYAVNCTKADYSESEYARGHGNVLIHTVCTQVLGEPEAESFKIQYIYAYITATGRVDCGFRARVVDKHGQYSWSRISKYTYADWENI